MTAFAIDFHSTPLDQHVPWAPARGVGWYELTTGERIVRVGDQRVFERDDGGHRRWLEQPVARLWEELLSPRA